MLAPPLQFLPEKLQPFDFLQLLLMLKIQYRLTYRTLEGFEKSILPLLQEDIALPTYSLICKRAVELGSQLPKLSRRKPQVILLDATGIKIHVADDAKSKEIIGLEITDGHMADCIGGPKLLKSVQHQQKNIWWMEVMILITIERRSIRKKQELLFPLGEVLSGKWG